MDRRNFLIRSAVGGAAAVMMGRICLGPRENSEGPRHAAGAAAGSIDAAACPKT